MTFMTPRSPTPPVVYEPRIFSGRIWIAGGPFAGIPFTFKAPYGVYMNAIQVLGRAMARGQISRFQIGPTSKTKLRSLDRTTLVRYEDAFASLSRAHSIDWSA
jgi:hypothetical protein